MATNKESKTNKTMDISKPGKTTPDTSSRPVLITHRPMVQDPMVKDNTAPSDISDKKEEGSVVHGEKTIEPVTSQLVEDAESSEVSSEIDEIKEPEVLDSIDDAKNNISVTNARPEKSETDSEQAEEEAIVGAVADQATEDKRKDNKESDSEKAKQANIQKLIDDKTFFVKVGQVSRRRKRRILLAFVVVFAILVGGYLAVDAGLIKTSAQLPYDFIKN